GMSQGNQICFCQNSSSAAPPIAKNPSSASPAAVQGRTRAKAYPQTMPVKSSRENVTAGGKPANQSFRKKLRQVVARTSTPGISPSGVAKISYFVPLKSVVGALPTKTRFPVKYEAGREGSSA